MCAPKNLKLIYVIRISTISLQLHAFRFACEIMQLFELRIAHSILATNRISYIRPTSSYPSYAISSRQKKGNFRSPFSPNHVTDV